MRARIKQEPVLQANSANYGTRKVLEHKPIPHPFTTRGANKKSEVAMNELNKLFEV